MSEPVGAQRTRRRKKRYVAERRFRRIGASAVLAAVAALVLLLGSILWRGLPAFFEHRVRLEVVLAASAIDPDGTRDSVVLADANYTGLLRDALAAQFPEVSSRRDRRALAGLLSSGAAYDLQERVLADPTRIGRTISFGALLSDEADLLLRGAGGREQPEGERALSDAQIGWLDALAERGLVERAFATRMLRSGDSREPELAGVWGAAVGSFWTLLTTLALSFPLGVAAAIYLEELAPKNRWTDLIEVNINNLAAVPSIVFGLLGLAIFLGTFDLPRSAPLVGGMVLALMTLPTVIIAARAAIRSVPPSIREAALGVGASQLQAVFHHVLPLAIPGILTGTIIGMARALGETAPLLMIGMVAFIVDVPGGPTEPATALPVQIFLWSDESRARVRRTNFRGDPRSADVPRANEPRGGAAPEPLRAPLVTEPERRTPFLTKISARSLNVYYGEKQALFDVNHRHSEESGHGADRSVRLRQVDVPPLRQPHERPIDSDLPRRRQAAIDGDDDLRGRESTSSRCARGSAWCFRSPIPSRSPSTRTSRTARASTASPTRRAGRRSSAEPARARACGTK